MEKDKTIREESIEILANASQVTVQDLKEALDNPTYKVFSIKKRSGGKRMIHAPIEKTKAVQEKIYRNFLLKVFKQNIIEKNCFGGVPKHSILGNAKIHSYVVPDFMVKLDIENAFHCITEKSLKSALFELFQIEVFVCQNSYFKFLGSKKNLKYRKSLGKDVVNFQFEIMDVYEKFAKKREKIFSYFREKSGKVGFRYNLANPFYVENDHEKDRPPLFPCKGNPAFRKMFKDPLRFRYVNSLCHEMSKILAKLLTYQGKVVQGSPTSPMIMALMVSYTQLLPKLYVDNRTVYSIYVDDITLSIFTKKNKEQLQKEMSEKMDVIEQNTIWKFNKRKTSFCQPMKETPLVTGLRLVRNRKTRQELKEMVKQKTKGAQKCLKAWEPWWYMKPTIPKKLQRKIRSCVYKACLPSNKDDASLQRQALSYIGYVFYIYQFYPDIPLQIRKKIDEYSELVNGKMLTKLIHKKDPD